MNKEQYKQRLSELSYALDNFDNLKKDSLYDCISLGAVGFEKLIKEHFDNHNNTAGFEHFKPFSDGTLKSMKKDDLIDYNHVLLNNWQATDELYKNVMEYAQRLQKELDNPPLEIKELEDGEWYWCNEFGWCLANIYEDVDGEHYKFNTLFNGEFDLMDELEEYKLYRKEIK